MVDRPYGVAGFGYHEGFGGVRFEAVSLENSVVVA
jgi:hypothetical protein